MYRSVFHTYVAAAKAPNLGNKLEPLDLGISRKRRPDPTFSLARLAVMVAIPLGGSFHV